MRKNPWVVFCLVFAFAPHAEAGKKKNLVDAGNRLAITTDALLGLDGVVTAAGVDFLSRTRKSAARRGRCGRSRRSLPKLPLHLGK